jgi:hypothetical protein
MRFTLPVLAGIAAFFILTALGTLVWAQDGAAAVAPASENALTQATSLAFQILTPIVTIIATWFAHRLVGIFEKKLKIDLPEKQEAQIDGWISQGIHWASETSYKKVKEKTSKLTGPEKLETAAAFVFDFAQARGWTEWSKDAIKKKIEAKLGDKRANGGVPHTDDA